MSNVSVIFYVLISWSLFSLHSAVSTAVSTHLITYTTATFHLGKFGGVFRCHSSFVVEKKYSAEVRPNFSTRSACAPEYSASAEHYKGHVRCISTDQSSKRHREFSRAMHHFARAYKRSRPGRPSLRSELTIFRKTVNNVEVNCWTNL